MLGVPINDANIMLGDNQSTITSCTIPSSNLKKRHNAIAYHRVRESVAASQTSVVHSSVMLNPGQWKGYTVD